MIGRLLRFLCALSGHRRHGRELHHSGVRNERGEEFVQERCRRCGYSIAWRAVSSVPEVIVIE